MPVLALDHVNIRTENLPATLDFFRDVLRMEVIVPPGCTDPSHAGWVLDENGNAVLHIARADLSYPGDEQNPFTPSHGSGSVHHVAFNCSDYDGTRQRFAGQGVAVVENHVAQIDLRQLFVKDPNGIIVELNFRAG